jgi:hypothetical protein
MAAHRRLVSIASYYDGRSCDGEGHSKDSITARRTDSGVIDVGGRMDHDGSFSNLQQCCVVQKCVFGKTPSACYGLDLSCPSRWGSVNPRTCQEEAPKQDADGRTVGDDAHREDYYHSQKDCCHAKVVLDGCTPRSPDHKMMKWEEICCRQEDDSSSALDSGQPRDSEDYLVA